jgi:hypothetical protein
VKVITRDELRNAISQYPNFSPNKSQTPTINIKILINTTNKPPIYFPTSSSVLVTGLERSKSIFPFSSIEGIKDEQENIESKRHNPERGLIIISSSKEILSEKLPPFINRFVLKKLKIMA